MLCTTSQQSHEEKLNVIYGKFTAVATIYDSEVIQVSFLYLFWEFVGFKKPVGNYILPLKHLVATL